MSDSFDPAHPMCRGGCTADAKGWLKRGGGLRALVGSRGEVGMSGRGMPDIPRFGALRRDNTPSPAECSWMIDSTMLLLELYGGGRKLAKAWAAPSLRCCCFVASPPASSLRMIVGSRGFYSPTPRGYNGNVTSQWVRIVGVQGPGLGPAEGLWFAGFP